MNTVARYMRADPAWALETVPGHRTPVFRKLADEAVSFARETLEQQAIRIAPVSTMAEIAAEAARDLGIR